VDIQKRLDKKTAIRFDRELLGLSQVDLAIAAGVPQSRVSETECGRPRSRKAAARIAAALDRLREARR
jgi:transcriptional regulator with XRE-family HTH domain